MPNQKLTGGCRQPFQGLPGGYKMSTREKVKRLVFEQGLSYRDAAKALNISHQAISKHVRKLRQQGEKPKVNRGLPPKGVWSGGGGLPPSFPIENYWRYHALSLELRPYYVSKKYYTVLKSRGGQGIRLGDWTLVFYYKKVMVWLSAGVDFIDEEKENTIIKASQSLNVLLETLRDRYGFHVVKEGRHGVRLVNHHLAYTDAPEHDIVTKDKMFIQLRGDDGKVFMQYDRSKGVKEREYVHPQLAIDHADTIEPYFKDFLNQPLTNSQLTSRLNDVVTALDKVQEILSRVS